MCIAYIISFWISTPIIIIFFFLSLSELVYYFIFFYISFQQSNPLFVALFACFLFVWEAYTFFEYFNSSISSFALTNKEFTIFLIISALFTKTYLNILLKIWSTISLTQLVNNGSPYSLCQNNIYYLLCLHYQWLMKMILFIYLFFIPLKFEKIIN